MPTNTNPYTLGSISIENRIQSFSRSLRSIFTAHPRSEVRISGALVCAEAR